MKSYFEFFEAGEPIVEEQIERDILSKRYFQPGETSWAEMSERIANHVASAELRFGGDSHARQSWSKKFYNALNSQLIVASSPILFNAGTPCEMLSACTGVTFAEDSIPAIMKAVTECATLTADGAGVGYDITPLRYRDAPLSRKGVSSGSCSWLKLMDAVGQTVRQGGRNRRAAMLAALDIQHPDAVEFCFIKDDTKALTHMNISLKVTDEFMEAVDRDELHHFEFPVGSGNRVELRVEARDMDSKVDPRYAVFKAGLDAGDVKGSVMDGVLLVNAVRAQWLFNLVAEHAHRTGEPGLLFIDEHARQNPIHSVAPITTTNPCGEVGLHQLSNAFLKVDERGVAESAHDSCNLAHLVLPRFMERREDAYAMNWTKLGDHIRLAVRFLDNVIELSEYRPSKIGTANRLIRKTGLGIIGFADILVMMGIKYDSEAALEFAHHLASWLEFWALDASAELARERGSFGLFDHSKYKTEGIAFRNFQKNKGHSALSPMMWHALDDRVRKGMRNTMVTMLAPTGSTALIVGNLSNSIEPIFFKEQRRRTVDAVEIVKRHWFLEEIVNGKAPAHLEASFVEAFDVSPEHHVSMQCAWQAWIGQAVSKTINLPSGAVVEDVRAAYMLAWRLKAKGITVYRDGSRGYQPVSNALVTMDKTGVLQLKPVTNAVETAAWVRGVAPDAFRTASQDRPEAVPSVTRKIEFNGQKLYVTIGRHPVSGSILEVLLLHGKAGSDEMAKMESLGRMISVALKYGAPITAVIKQLKNIGGETMCFYKGRRFSSLPDAIGQMLEEELGLSKPKTAADAEAVALMIQQPTTALTGASKCPECHETTYLRVSGCGICQNPSCRYSACQ